MPLSFGPVIDQGKGRGKSLRNLVDGWGREGRYARYAGDVIQTMEGRGMGSASLSTQYNSFKFEYVLRTYCISGDEYR